MDEEEYEDYLVDKAKDLLKEQTSDLEEVPEADKEKHLTDDMKEKENSKIPFSWDPREIEHLARNRKSMTNKDLEEFMESDSKIHEEMEEIDEWKGFSRWEERLIIQRHGQDTVEEIASEIQRDEREVKLKMRIMGFKPEE